MAGQAPPPSAPWTAPPPAAPSWVPRPPKPSRGRVWIYLLVGAVLTILGLAVASGTIWVQKVKPPIDAANDYLRDISRGHYEAAFAQLCAQERVDGSPRSLQDTVGRVTFFGVGNYEVSPFDVHIDGNRATLNADLNSGDFRGADTVRLRLQKFGGTWRPCGGQFGFEDRRLASSPI